MPRENDQRDKAPKLTQAEQDQLKQSALQRAYEIGFRGSYEEVVNADKYFRSRNNDMKILEASLADGYHLSDYLSQELARGVEQAFVDGRPEVLRGMIAAEESWKLERMIGCSWALEWLRYAWIINKYQSDVFDAAAVLMNDKTPEEKQAELNEMLTALAEGHMKDTRTECVTGLLRAGAKTSQENMDQLLWDVAKEGYLHHLIPILLKNGATMDKGSKILALAVEARATENTVKILHAAGADFDQAIYFAKARQMDPKVLTALTTFQKKITGKGDDLPEIIRQLQEQVKDLTEQVKVLQAGQNPKPPKLD